MNVRRTLLMAAGAVIGWEKVDERLTQCVSPLPLRKKKANERKAKAKRERTGN